MSSGIENGVLPLVELGDKLPMLSFDVAMHAHWVSAAWQRLVGAPTDEARLGGRWLQDVHPDDWGHVMEVVKVWDGQPENCSTELRLRHADGTFRWCLFSVYTMAGDFVSEQSLPGEYLGLAVDIHSAKMKTLQLQLKADLLQRLCEIGDRERRMMGYEIHDGLLQDIIATRMLLEGKRQPAAGDAVTTASRSLELAIQGGRQLIWRLSSLENSNSASLTECVDRLIHEARQRVSFTIDLQSDVTIFVDSQIWIDNLCRMIQESLSNIERHGNATTATVALTSSHAYVRVVIADNGSGFDVSNVSATSNGTGLKSLRERADAFAGELEIKSVSGVGTTIAITIPKPASLD